MMLICNSAKMTEFARLGLYARHWRWSTWMLAPALGRALSVQSPAALVCDGAGVLVFFLLMVQHDAARLSL